MGTKGDDKEKYALYTEKVVLHPAKKYRWLIRIGKVLLFAVSVVIVATAFMAFLYPRIQSLIEQKNKDKEVVYIKKDNYVFSDDEETVDADILTEKDLKDNYEAAMATLRTKVESVKKSIVAVDIEQPVTDIPSVEKSQTEVAGLVVANLNSKYLILTKSDILKNNHGLIVTLSDDEQIEAEVVCIDDSIGIGLVSISETRLSQDEKNALSIAVLDNSYMVHQGDIVIVTGRIYGSNNAIDYGTIAGITTQYAKDNAYEIFETNVTVSSDGFGFLFNSEGRAVGISRSTDSSTMQFIGISDLKAHIETMINHHGIMYCGITAQNVTSDLAEKYNLPSGVYVAAVDIDSPAYYAGLQAGDVIVGINGQSILTIQQFREKLYQCADGETMLVTAKRQGKDGYSDVIFGINVQLKPL